jgi:hypothetical protein
MHAFLPVFYYEGIIIKRHAHLNEYIVLFFGIAMPYITHASLPNIIYI